MQYRSWVESRDDPLVIWLSGLHIPESYFTALVQQTCRNRAWPLDKKVGDSVLHRLVDPKPFPAWLSDAA